jgi:adenosylhomocysteine nucleosidase
VDGTERWTADPGLCALLGGATPHTLLGGGSVLATIAEKAAAHGAGADAIDLESAAVARAATAAGLPFAVLRAICDEAGHALPLAAQVALDASGHIGFMRILAALLRQPNDIFPLIALGRDAARARTALLGRVRATSLLRHQP